MAREVNLRAIHPHGGDQRCAFEQLCWLLFARANVNRGIPRRREGAGGDAGLEGELVDAEGRAIVGIQAKFYADKLESTQWRNLDSSIRTALAGNASDGLLEEIVVTLPRELTLAQLQKWDAFRKAWQTEAAHLKYRKVVGFTLWGEAALLDLLLRFENRGLLLHYFEVPDFDRERCLQKTRTTIRALGDRYQPDLHTPTEAEDKLHTFLRSERCRQQFLDKAREDLRERAWLPTQKSELPQSLNEALSRAEAAWQRAQPFFGDGVSLPSSFTGLATALIESAEALMPIIEGLSALMPPRQPRSDDDYHTPQSRGPYEEVLRRFDNWEWHLRSLAGYLRGNALADQSCLLLTGDPGTGKSHLLAEVCSRYGEQGGIVLFLEGAKFSTDEPPWTQLMRWAGFPSNSARDLIETLSAMAAATSVPALICIDALNETPNRNLWRNGVLDFTAELHANDQVKLLVSCRSDYLEQTLPAALREHSVPGWAFADHHGLGVDVFEAFPKYVAAYNVRWRGLPPLVEEFRNPLFLRVFCEAYASQAPEEGSLSLGTILGHYARRKAELLGQRIDCDPSRALDALRDLAVCIQAGHGLQISEREARTICERHHAPTETSRSLYRALLSESILAEFPGPMDALGPQHLVRFTFERVWDYFISLTLLPPGGPVSESLATRLRDEDWRWQNAGLVSLLNVRFPEEGQGELCDAIALDGGIPDPDTLEQFLDSLPWRTHASFSARTVELFELATDGGLIENSLVHIVPLAPNPQHPWNADWLHQKLTAIPLAERDRTWTFWVNEQLFQLYEDSPLRELLSWAERAPMPALADEHRFLLASVLAWCASTTVVESRKRLAAAIARVIAGRTQLAVRLVRRFLSVDDPYVLERVLLAAAGAAQHASAGDVHLAELARVVHCGVFGGKTTKAHLLVRHYATEICQQAEAKGVLPPEISPQSFHPPFRSRWPRIWSEKRCEEKQKTAERADLFRSVVPDKGGPGYGNWGRYVMQGHVSQFLPQKLSEPVEAVPKGHRPRFDASVARRYVIQRVFEIGWDPQSPDNLSNVGYDGHRPKVERLSKKYQWIALYELLALLSDHYRFHDYNDSAATFQSARQLIGSELLDPFVIEPPPPQAESTWSFVRSPAPWWRGHLDLWPKPLSLEQQREAAAGPGIFHPEILFRLNDGKHDWLTLSAFHLWNEPQPVWASGRSSPFVEIETAIQSYLVRPSKATNLLRALSERDFEHHSRIWLEEPDFGQPLASLRTFPLQQDDLRLRCEIDEGWDRDWDTGACSTTCRCAPDEEQRRARDGSMPSPQLAELGNLRWLGRAFDFASPGQSTPLVCHVGKGFEGACIVRCDAMLDWLRSSDRRLVWRCFIQKYLHNQPLDQTLSRAYWSTFILLPSGEIVHFGGATCTFPHGPGPEEPLPWSETRVSKP